MNNELIIILQTALNEYFAKTMSEGIRYVLGSDYWDTCNEILNDSSTRSECKVSITDEIPYSDLPRLFYLLTPPEGIKNIWSQMIEVYPELNYNKILSIRNLKRELENSNTEDSFTYARVKRELNNICSALAPIDSLIFQKMSSLFSDLEKMSPLDSDSKVMIDLSEDIPYHCEQIKREFGKIVLDDQGHPVIEKFDVDPQELIRFFSVFQYETVEKDVYIIDQEELDNIYQYVTYYTSILDQIKYLESASVFEIPLLTEKIQSMILASDFSYQVLDYCKKIIYEAYLRGAEGGDLYCICQVAHEYYTGKTINAEVDYEKTAFWAQAALKITPVFNEYLSEKFYYNTVTLLGIIYARGEGGNARDDARAKEYFKLAADHGDLQGLADYFIMCCEEINQCENSEMINELEKNVRGYYPKVMNCLESYPEEFYAPNSYDYYNPYNVSVKALLSEVYFVFGRMLIKSKKSTKKEVLFGIENLKMAAQLSNPKSMNLLGKLYGYYMPKKDLKEAFHWFDLAYQVDPNDEQNTIFIILCYNGGRGVVKNTERAMELLKPLVDKENEDAIMIFQNGFSAYENVKKDEIKKDIKSLKKSLKKGDDGDWLLFMCLLPPVAIYKMWKYELFDQKTRKDYTTLGTIYSFLLCILFSMGFLLLGVLFLKIVFIGAIFSMPVYFFIKEFNQIEDEQIEN